MTAPPDASGLAVAGVPRRLVAYALDIGIALSLSMVPGVVIGLLVLGSAWWAPPWSDPVARWQPGSGERYLLYLVVSEGVALALELGYFLAFWTRGRGATPGMRVLGLRIADAGDGGLLTLGAGVRRWLAMGSWLAVLILLPGIEDLAWAAWGLYLVVLVATTLRSPLRRGFHDRVGGSVVLEPAPRTGHPLAVGCLALALLWGIMIGLTFFLVSGGA